MLSASQATFHPNQCHLCSCLLIYMLDSAGEMKSAANKSYSSALAKALIGAESPKSAKDSTPKPNCLESLPEMGISQLSDIPAAEVWDGNTATELSQNESRTSRESCPVHVFQTWAHRGWNPGSMPSLLSQPHNAFQQGYSSFPMLFQLWIAVTWERGQLLLTSLDLKQQQRYNMLSVLPSTQTKVKLYRSQLENIVEKM